MSYRHHVPFKLYSSCIPSFSAFPTLPAQAFTNIRLQFSPRSSPPPLLYTQPCAGVNQQLLQRIAALKSRNLRRLRHTIASSCRRAQVRHPLLSVQPCAGVNQQLLQRIAEVKSRNLRSCVHLPLSVRVVNVRVCRLSQATKHMQVNLCCRKLHLLPFPILSSNSSRA